MTFTPTPEQQAIVAAATETKDNLLVSALAGAAKTSTLVLVAQALKGTQILCLAFNKRIAEEMKSRLPANCDAMTLNSLGHRAWAQYLNGRRLNLDTKKTYRIVGDLIEKLDAKDKEAAYPIMADLMRNVDFGKACGYIPTGHYPQIKGLMDDAEFFAHLEEEPGRLEEDLIRAATLQSLREAIDGTIDFGDQLLMPTLWPTIMPFYPLVLIDEAQDLSALNHAMLRKLAKKRLIAVGDPCQPVGTMVAVLRENGTRWKERRIEQVPIEQLVEGDTLVGYDTGYSEFMFNRKVKGITAKPFIGNLVKVVSEGGVSRYTPNHHCFASFSRLRKHTALYAMRSGNRWRVGIAAMDYKGASGPIARARAEQADAMWILATFPTRQEALAAEAAVQAAWGIPDITFEWAGVFTNGYAAPEALKSVWNRLDNIDFTARGIELLTAFNREYDYPMWTPETTYATFKRPIVVRACNLLNGGEVLPFAGKKREKLADWKPYEIRYEPYDGLVYSLTVSHNQLFVADGLVTHNCQSIYGFRGAHQDSMSVLKQSFDMRELHLTVSFRCPVAVVEAARWRAPAMQYPEWAKEGSVESIAAWEVTDVPTSETAIICRNNAPLFSMAIKLLRDGRYPELVGNDLGKSLIKMLRKLGPPSMAQREVLAAIDDWKQTKLIKARNPDRVHDQAACLRVFAEEGSNLQEAIDYADRIMSVAGPVKLMTGHKSKGLEFETVLILDRDLINLKEDQEKNLLYVMQTRAKERLVYVDLKNYYSERSEADE